MDVMHRSEASTGDWADQTRRVLTRDLLLRAHRSSSGEARALEFRVLHLNLPLVRGAADDLGLTGARRARAERDGLEGLLEAVRQYDPYDDRDFAEVATPMVEHRMRRHAADARPTGRPVRLVVHRVALAIAGTRT
jgi:DNA-directed RNA polymerase specialized sigma subunit